MPEKEEMVRLTIAVPNSLRRLLKVSAAQNDRSFSGEIIHCLKHGAGWSVDEQPDAA
jgi:hypothetical protein